MRPVSMLISNGRSTLAVSNGTNPTIVRSGSSGDVDQLDLDGARAALRRPLDLQLDDVAGLVVGQLRRRGRRPSPAPRRRCRCSVSPGSSDSSAGADVVHSVVGGLEAHEVGDDDVAGHDRGVVEAERLQGDVLGDLRRRAHHLQRDAGAPGCGVARAVQLHRSVRDRRSPARRAPDPPRQHRLRRLGDRHEVDVARAVLVDLGDALQLAERHAVVDRLRPTPGRRAYGVASTTIASGSVRVGHLLAGDQLGRQDGGDGDGDEHEQGEHGQRHGPPAVAVTTARRTVPAGGRGGGG